MSTNENPVAGGDGVSEGSLAAQQITQEHGVGVAPAQAQAINETQLVKTIKAHLAKAEKYQSKAEEHFITAGQYLMTLKGNSPDQATFLQIVKEQIGLGKSRTYELLQIADGTKTGAEIQQANAERKAKERAKLSVTSRTNGDHDMPTVEEAEESYQQTLRDHGQPYDHQSPWAAHNQPRPETVFPEDDEPEDEGDSPEVIWRRGLLYRAEEAAGNALYEDWSQFTVDSEVVAAAERAAEAWEKTAAYLRELRHARLRSDTSAVTTDALDDIPPFLQRTGSAA
jgi:uncharacterized protein with GYD domain